MLCRFGVTPFVGNNRTSAVWLINVPDDVYMYHMAAYNMFMPAALTDAELGRCTFLGKLSDIECTSAPTE